MKCSNLTAFFSFLLFALPYLGKGQSNIPLFSTEDYLVSSTIAVPLSVNGQALASNTIYRVGLVTLGTGTHTGASFLVWKDNTSGKWKVRNVAISGSTSNHPLLAIDSSNIVVVRTNHINKYNVRAFVESFPVGVPAAVPSMLGESYQWQRDVSDLVYLDGIFYKSGNVYAYELRDQTGNVRAVIAKSGSSLEVRGYSDYYSYGMVLRSGGINCRYGYQGAYAEKDWNAFELRMYDSRIARWLTIDPAAQYASPYMAKGTDPVNGVDPDGGFNNSIYDPTTRVLLATDDRGLQGDANFMTKETFDKLGGQI